MKTAGRRKTFLAWGIVALMASACATTRPANQSFVSLRTPNFEILSALGRSQTRALARDLELFHAGVLAIAGLEETPDWREPTRVLAFDDRSLGRPFGIRGRTAYFVPGVDRGTLVFRVPGGWHERASRELRADYAQRLIRGRSPRRLPLWVEEGLAQVASGVRVGDGQVLLGASIQQHVTAVLDWRRSSFGPLLQTSDLSSASKTELERFEAESWALLHTLMFDATEGSPSARFPAAFFGQDGSGGTSWLEALVGNNGAALADRVHRHLGQRDFALRVLQLRGWDWEKLELEPVSPARARVLLGDLADALGRERLAADLLERALSEETGREGAAEARALATLAWIRLDRFEEAESLLGQALAAAEDDAKVRSIAGSVYARAAANRETADERSSLLRAAREHLRAAHALRPSSADPLLELARTHLVDGEDLAAALELAESAAMRRPGSLEIDLVRARLEAKRGRRTAARLLAQEVASRSGWAPLRQQARELLEALERDRGRPGRDA